MPPRQSGAATSLEEEGYAQIVLPRALPHQIEVISDPNRFKVVVAGRRWGKTILGLLCVIQGHGPVIKQSDPHSDATEEALSNLFPTKTPGFASPQRTRITSASGLTSSRIGALQGGNIWWVCPTYNISNQIWRDLKRALQGAWSEKSEVERRIVLPGGGSITVRSTDNPDSLRGSGLDGIVVDEAAFVKEEAWQEALRPALSDRQGWAIFISTPNGRNWFWRMFEMAPKRPGWQRWQRPTSDNPKIPPTELEDAKKEVGPYVFSSEYEGKFVSPASHQFRPEWFRYFQVDSSTGMYHLRDNLGNIKSISPTDVFRFCTTDLATSLKQTADYSVITTFGITPDNDLLVLDNSRNRLEGPDHIAMLNQVYQKWRPGYIGIEKQGFQLSIVQAALRQGLPIRPLSADKDKVSRASTILTRFAAGAVYARENSAWLDEWEQELMNFPHGDHDDQVDALSYAGILLAERPNRKMFFYDLRKLAAAFCLPSVLSDSALHDRTSNFFSTAQAEAEPGVEEVPDAPGNTEVPEDTSTPEEKLVEWRVAGGSSLEDILDAISPSFTGDASTLWHAHLSVARGGNLASVALGRISNWKRVITTVEGAPMEIEVPLFEIPLTVRIIAPRLGNLDLSACADFIIALRQVRRFLITSASVAGFQSASLVQKFVRAGLVTVGALIDPNTGIPYGAGSPMNVDKQPYTDLLLAVNDRRIKLMNYGWASHELQQLEDAGESLTGIKETADSVAGVVGYLCRYGHSILTVPSSHMVELDDVLPGMGEYQGVRFDTSGSGSGYAGIDWGKLLGDSDNSYGGGY